MIQISDKTKNILEWIYCVIVALILALLIRYFIGTPTVVKHVSMFPTLKPNQRLILNKIPAKTLKKLPERGDIITFEAPSNSTANSVKAEYENEPKNLFKKFIYYGLEIGKTSYIKRVIAFEGEHVQIRDGKVYIDGKQLNEDYLPDNVKTEPQNTKLMDFTVPKGYIFAMGDNRAYSMDCRNFGCIPVEKIESVVWIRFWPLNLMGDVR